MAHTKSGIRDIVMPGARKRCTVATKLTPVNIDENPATKTANATKQADTPSGK